MQIRVLVVMALNFLVTLLLLLGVGRMTPEPVNYLRIAFGAVVAGMYGGICMYGAFSFLGQTLWRLLSMGVTVCVAFGFGRSSLRRGVFYILLQMALTGISAGMARGGLWSAVVTGGMVCVMVFVLILDRPGVVSYVPVELRHRGNRLLLTALRDTGNTLRDPVTGQQVLVVGAEVAGKLTGLTPQQLRSPIEAIQEVDVPGLRLIPYRTIDRTGGMLLAIRVADVKIGNWKGSSLVAFAPEKLDENGRYQALTGGAA